MKIEDIRNGVAENPELKSAIIAEFDSDIPTYLTGKGYVVRSAEDQVKWEKDFETNKIKPRVKELYLGLETDLLNTFGEVGLNKAHDEEKVFDMVKRVPSLYEAKIAELNTIITDLKAGKGDDVSKKQIVALQSELAALKADKDALSGKFSQREIEWQKTNDQEKAFAELQINVPAHIADADKADYIASKREQLLTTLNTIYKAETKEIDGKPTLVYTKGGEIQMKGSALATAQDLLMEVGKYDFTTKQKGGSGGEGGSGDGNVGDYAGVTDKASLYAMASKKGLVNGSAEWLDFVKKGKEAKGIKD